MSAPRLIIDAGVAETRSVLIRDNRVRRIWLAPARGDETEVSDADTGDIFFGRIKSVSAALGGAFVDIGGRRDGFLNAQEGVRSLCEGEAVTVRVKRPALGRKGALLVLADASAPVGATPPVRLSDPLDPALEPFRSNAPGGVAIVHSNDVKAAALARESLGTGVEVVITPTPLEDNEGDHWFEASLRRSESLAGGGSLIFDESEAACLVDVDAGGAGSDRGVGGASANDAVNARAAEHLFEALDRRAIGGNIIVDFSPPSNDAALREISRKIRRRAERRGGAFGAASRQGVIVFSLPRRGPSLLERVSVIADGDALRPARVLSLDWRAKMALRNLEQALRRVPSGRFSLNLCTELYVFMAAHPRWRSRLIDRYGARFDIKDATRDSRGDYDLVEYAT